MVWNPKVKRRGGRQDTTGVARRLPLLLTLAWVALLGGSTVASGCPRFSSGYALCLGVLAAVAAVELVLLRRLYLHRFPLRAFRKCTGYAIVIQYVAQTVSRAEWVNGGLVGARRAAVLYALILACTAVGILLFVVLGRRSVRAEFADAPARSAPRAGRGRRALGLALGWGDSLLSAVVAVILINAFVFQLYAVPTESMAPVFLGGDRPVAIKATAGPRLPLTEYRLPSLREPRAGDIVTIANPRYPENSTVSPRRYLSQLLYTVTLTTVNIDRTAADGSPRADPLVKRIVAVPGEKIMMVDDVLYVRTPVQPEFRPVPGDRERRAQIDLWKLPASLRAKIEYLPADRATREMLLSWDARKNEADPADLSRQLLEAAARVKLALAAIPEAVLSRFEKRELARADSPLAAHRRELMLSAASPGHNPIGDAAALADDLAIALGCGRSPALLSALDRYAAGAAAAPVGATSYDRGSHALNLLVKLNVLTRVERDLALVTQGASARAIEADEDRSALIREAGELYVYLHKLYDARNFPEFPAGEQFLGADEYFAMGDNRYNSQDFRFASESKLRALDPGDPESVRYPSALAPFALKRQFIESYAVLRVWPPSRIGVLR